MTQFIAPPNSNFYVIYRVSDKGHNLDRCKLTNATKQHCLMNALEQFGRENFYVIADNCSEELIHFLKSEGLTFEETHLGNSPSFKYAVTQVINTYDDNDIVYLLEDDYLHLPGSKQFIIEGLGIADYVTLYDHPDQYLTYIRKRDNDAAPLNRFGLHRWRIFLTEHSHWRETPSTTMTFAARVKTLKQDYKILMNNPDKGIPHDFAMFLTLTKQSSLIDAAKLYDMRRIALGIVLNNFAIFRKKRLLISCVPGRATHCEPKLLSPLTDWTKI